MRFVLTLTSGLFFFLQQFYAAPIPKDLENTESKLAGKWKLTYSGVNNGPLSYNFYITFKPKGELEFTREYPNNAAQTRTFSGKYKILGDDKIDYTINEFGNERGEILRIKKLSKTELQVVDPNDVREEFKRELPVKKK